MNTENLQISEISFPSPWKQPVNVFLNGASEINWNLDINKPVPYQESCIDSDSYYSLDPTTELTPRPGQ